MRVPTMIAGAMIAACASAKRVSFHIEAGEMNGEEKQRVHDMMVQAQDRLEHMREEMEGMDDDFMHGPPPSFFDRMFGGDDGPPPPPRPFFFDDEHSRPHHMRHHHGDFHHGGPRGHGGPNHGGPHHGGPHHGPHHGFLGRFFGPPPPPPPRLEEEDQGDRGGMPAPRHHHRGPHDLHRVFMMCEADHQKFCAEKHHPFFVTVCLNHHRTELSEGCAEVLPKHPYRCLMMHLLMTFLMAYIFVRVVRITLRWMRMSEHQRRYPGQVVLAQKVDSTNNAVHLGKVVPVELADVAPLGTAALPAKVVAV